MFRSEIWFICPFLSNEIDNNSTHSNVVTKSSLVVGSVCWRIPHSRSRRNNTDSTMKPDNGERTHQGISPDSKVHGANMGPTWVLSAPDGSHVRPMNLAIRDRSYSPGPIQFSFYLEIQPAYSSTLLFIKYIWALTYSFQFVPHILKCSECKFVLYT